MNIYRKICVVFSNFNKKLIDRIKFGQKTIPGKKIGKKFESISFYHSLKSKEIKHFESMY